MPRDANDTKTRELPGMADRREFGWRRLKLSFSPEAITEREAYMAGWKDAYRDAERTLLDHLRSAK